MTKKVPALLGLLALLAVYTVYLASSDTPRLISPQGCRMSWMSPSYLLQPALNTSWTPLAGRYSLWLYREVGWEPNQAMGVPVLFIPGNAGSSHQVRSIASSAARQYFSEPFVVSSEFTGRKVKSLDFYAVEFNEDLSAFHGPTLDSEIAYTSAAITYILSHYPPNTQIIIMGHSMGGIVGTALLPSEHISALVTMSTPHTLPPARFDSRVGEIYERNRKLLKDDETPILSICGGATDMMIPSESCILPESPREVDVYRRTVFTSALEGAWTGVGHREMAWCHQVRWRIARAALELGGARSSRERTHVLDRWLRDGHLLPPGGVVDAVDAKLGLKEGEYEILPEDIHLVLKHPRGKRTYLLPITSSESGDEPTTFVLYVSQGSISGVAPHHALNLHASVQLCTESANHPVCTPLAPTTLKLLPSPVPGEPFPVPDEGSDESEGVVLFEGQMPRGREGWVGVSIEAGGDGGGWVVGGFDQEHKVVNEISLSGLIFGVARIAVPKSDNGGLRMRIAVPQLPANALLVYRLIPQSAEISSCADPLLPPLLLHSSHSSEIHYYPLSSKMPIALHTHSSAPYMPPLNGAPSHGLNLVIYSSGASCHDANELFLTIDWWATAGRIGTRYPTTLLSWGIGIVSLLLFHSWGSEDHQLSVSESLRAFVKTTMLKLMGISALTAILPLGPDYHLGNGGEIGVMSGLLAGLLVVVATGMVCVTWWVLVALLWPLKFSAKIFAPTRRPDDGGLRRSAVISMVAVLLLIFLFVPWQVAFLGCWLIQLFNCAASSRGNPYPGSTPTIASTPTESIALREQTHDGDKSDEDELPTDHPSSASLRPGNAPPHISKFIFAKSHHQNTHILLLMMWLLPLTAPVLAVWVRTLQTAGYTTPFNGDHNVLKIAPVLLLVDYKSRGRLIETKPTTRISPRWGFVVVAGVAFLVGGRNAYLVYDVANLQITLLLLGQVAAWWFN
ncbi:hypothetical protein HYDPIDRAFT_104430 [Hydnomerulius pinastri MD-312]|nr:hypothetical protein HYDPIDRAFT_104430 [Hydnomerulius pinastri MD-312]